ncbi:hypothetical protein SISSUDRAFT_960140, partial [Sistotremastrum suecicum HHB10207 ss-3]
ADDWPLLVYQNGQYDEIDPSAGVFRNEALIQVCKYIFLGPSSIKNNGNSRSTRKSNADKHEMKTINVAVIAYCCLLVC